MMQEYSTHYKYLYALVPISLQIIFLFNKLDITYVNTEWFINYANSHYIITLITT